VNQRIAITRSVPISLAACELTHLARVPIDVEVARAQHAAYEVALAECGCRVERLRDTPDLPDSVFVEDTAIVLDELAVVTRPGAESRRSETETVREALGRYRQITGLVPPATLDGGDVLRLGRTLYVGVGGRTNSQAVAQLESLIGPHGYAVRTVTIRDCLHLKSAVTELAPGLLLLNPAWVAPRAFEHHDALAVDDGEPLAANVLRLGDTILCAARFERTQARLEAHGLAVRPLDVSELAKAEAGLTCCCLIVEQETA
jgi:dimethylargininase